MLQPPPCSFFNDAATTEIYTLSLRDALPICFIVAVRAPGSGHDSQHHLALELRIIARYQLAVYVRKLEGKHFIGIAHSSMLHEVVRLRKALGSRGFWTICDERLVGSVSAFQLQLQRSIRLRCHFRYQRARAVEVTENEFAILEVAVQCTGVAINAQDGCGDRRPMLLDDEAPRFLSLLTVVLDLPNAADLRHTALENWLIDVWRGRERLLRDIGLALKATQQLALEFAAFGSGDNLGEVMLEVERDEPVAECCVCGCLFVVAVIEGSGKWGALAGDVETEGNHGPLQVECCVIAAVNRVGRES